jgi:hypothetical protein
MRTMCLNARRYLSRVAMLVGFSLMLEDVHMLPAQTTPQVKRSTRPYTPNGGMSRQLDRIGTQVLTLERKASDASAGRPFFEDPEDSQSARSGFFLTSSKVLSLAVAADSGNAVAWYHLGLVTAERADLGFGTWDTTLVKSAIQFFEAAKERARAKSFVSIRPSVEKALRDEKKILASIK